MLVAAGMWCRKQLIMNTSKQTGWWYGLALWAGFLLSGWVHAEEMPKMATVDIQKLFKEYHRTIASQEHFNAEVARIQKGANERAERINRIKMMLRSLKAEIKKGELGNDTREAKVREERMLTQEVKMMENGLRQYSEIEKRRVTKLKIASMQGIMKEIKQKVSEHAEKQGFDFVFDKSGKNTNQVSFFIYLRDAQDITAHMLKELNKFAPEEGDN